MARPPKLTPAIQSAIVNAVAAGVPYSRACLLAGVSEYTGLEWLRRGEGRHERPATPLYAQFAHAIQKARAQDEARRVARIHQAGQGGAVLYEKTVTTQKPDGTVVTTTEVRKAAPQWTADAWHLERSRPEAWGRKDRVDLTLLVRQQAEKLAEQYDLDVEALLAEAEQLSRGRDV